MRKAHGDARPEVVGEGLTDLQLLGIARGWDEQLYGGDHALNKMARALGFTIAPLRGGLQ